MIAVYKYVVNQGFDVLKLVCTVLYSVQYFDQISSDYQSCGQDKVMVRWEGRGGEGGEYHATAGLEQKVSLPLSKPLNQRGPLAGAQVGNLF